MQVHRALPTNPILKNCALTIGTFDGVHRGHQLLIERLRSEAVLRGLQTATLTFDDMPVCLLRPDLCPHLLTLAQEKIDAFSRTPLDHLFVVPFTRDIANQGAREWMKRWVDTIGLKLFVGGPDFALGRGREGSINALSEIGNELGFEAFALDGKLMEDDVAISSTRSRNIIERGDVALAPQFLGRFYRIDGRVVGGQRLGRTIGFPTINVEADKRKCVPCNGVYAARVFWDDQIFDAALNIGVRPTIDSEGGNEFSKRHIEFHVIGQRIETAPANVRVEFVARIREERKFSGLEALKRQLHRDVEFAKKVLEA